MPTDDLGNKIDAIAQGVFEDLDSSFRGGFPWPGKNKAAKTAAPESANIPPDVAIARYIDHTLLKPDAASQDIMRLCQEAREYHFASVCVNASYVSLCKRELESTPDVAVCAVAGFPLGATLTEVKAFEAAKCIEAGAREIDMVINVGALKDGGRRLVFDDIRAVVEVVRANDALCKVILETGLLDEQQKIIGCLIAMLAGADFVKTSTGFGPGGATVEDVALMRRVVGENLGVKASGGVRTYADAQAMIAAGANRIGASAGIRIVREARGEGAGASQQGY